MDGIVLFHVCIRERERARERENHHNELRAPLPRTAPAVVATREKIALIDHCGSKWNITLPEGGQLIKTKLLGSQAPSGSDQEV